MNSCSFVGVVSRDPIRQHNQAGQVKLTFWMHVTDCDGESSYPQVRAYGQVAPQGLPSLVKGSVCSVVASYDTASLFTASHIRVIASPKPAKGFESGSKPDMTKPRYDDGFAESDDEIPF